MLPAEIVEFDRLWMAALHAELPVVARVERYLTPSQAGGMGMTNAIRAFNLARALRAEGLEFERALEESTRGHRRPFKRTTCPECGDPDCPTAEVLDMLNMPVATVSVIAVVGGHTPGWDPEKNVGHGVAELVAGEWVPEDEDEDDEEDDEPEWEYE